MSADSHVNSCHGEQNASCSCKLRLQEALRKYFGFPNFRAGQMEASLSVLHGQDVFVRMATGAGKSLCMFMAPLVRSDKAIGVIISPLNGLMEQQVELLRGVGITAIRVSGASMYHSITQGEYRFVFLSPEVAVHPLLRKIFQTPVFKQHLTLIAVDEAHCIPEWGSKFRTAFRDIGGLRALTDVPIMALSASAPPVVTKDIMESLQLKSPAFISHTLDRPNIFFSISKSKGLTRDLAGLCDLLGKQAVEVPKTIVFCGTKNDCSKVFCLLAKAAHRKHVVSMYHASLTQASKAEIHAAYKSGAQLRCLSATIAFGMGMDIPDIELVVVYGLPSSVSQLYQLCGRAGRGGCPSRAHIVCTGDEGKIKDPTLKSLCADRENCFRAAMLAALGGAVEQPNSMCCQTCNPMAFSGDGGRLDVMQVGKSAPRKKRRVAVRRVDEQTIEAVQMQLMAERETYIAEHPSLGILGAQYVCPDSVIKTISSSAKYISGLSDMNNFCVRQDLKKRFFDVLFSVVNS